MEVPAAWLSAATVLAGLWIGDRVFSPISQLNQLRREIRASLVVALSLRDAAAEHTGKDHADALNALADARRDLAEEADRLDAMARRLPPPLRLYAAARGYNLAQAASALRRLSGSLAAPGGQRFVDMAVAEAHAKDLAVQGARSRYRREEQARRHGIS